MTQIGIFDSHPQWLTKRPKFSKLLPMPVVPQEEIKGRMVKAKSGPVKAVSGNHAVEGGIVHRAWPERGQWYYKLIDPETSSKLPSYFAASGFQLEESAE
jgi:hypothetical protein